MKKLILIWAKVGAPLFCVVAMLGSRLTLIAAILTVVNTKDNFTGSLRQAIQDAASGDSLNFAIPISDLGYNPATGIYTITLTSGPLSGFTSLNIIGPGAQVLTISGNNSSSISMQQGN